MTAAWESDPVFGELADAIASDRLIVYTGSGISSGLRRAAGKMPAWRDLLEEVAKAIALSPDDARDVEALLKGEPPGAQLIEAASILEQADEARFASLVCSNLTPAKTQQADVVKEQAVRHDAVLALQPRGIVTLNIDRQHHEALQRRGLSWVEIDPTRGEDEPRMRALLSDPSGRQFLLEAHGSLAKGSSIVFTHRAYRDLIEKNPTYKAFLGNLFINFRFVFLGFRMTDLDFDELLTQTALTFGEPPQQHIVVRKAEPSDEEERRKVHYRRRFGMRFLDVPSHEDVWEAIQKAISFCGPGLEESIRRCASEAIAERKEGHRALGALGPAGKAVAIRVITARIQKAAAASVHEASEYVYSLKHLASGTNPADRRRAKDALFDLLDGSNDVEILAHAITALEAYLETDDLDRLESASRSLLERPLIVPDGFRDPDGRLPVYLEAAILRQRASGLSDPSWPVPARPGPPLVRPE